MSGRDDNDRLRAGEALDPSEGEMVDPSAVVDPGAAPVLSLEGHAPTLASVYGLAELERDRGRGLVSLARLPKWPWRDGDDRRALPAPGECGHGWGPHLDHVLGGGLAPGETIAIGAASAGAGKTAFVMQIVDGLALRCVLEQGTREPLTPVLVLSEMGPAPLSWRSLARWTGYSARIFRAGRSASSMAPSEAREAEDAWRAAREALAEGSEFARSRSFVRVLRSPSLATGGPDVLHEAAALVEHWRAELALTHHGRDVVPIVVVDPIQRYQGGERSEVEALNATVEALGRVAEERGWIGLVTSDTNKTSASGKEESSDDRERGVASLRGSYKLQHLPSAVLSIGRVSEADDRDGCATLRVVVVKNRWGSARAPWPRLRWHLRTGRMLPFTESEARAAEESEDRKATSSTTTRTAKVSGDPLKGRVPE
jgi:hypothetical protein